MVAFILILLLASLPLTQAQNAQHSKSTAQPDLDVSGTDPVEKEYLRLLAEDDAAQADALQWIEDAREQGKDPISDLTVAPRIEQRYEKVRKRYQDFLSRHPDHARARLAYGSFLNDMHEEIAAAEQWEKARELDPTNPAAWNNLANLYGHRGPVKKAFEYYEEAIKLDPKEPVYQHNLAVTTYLFRKDAREYYDFTEQQVFDKAIQHYKTAMKLQPEDFPLATDFAQTFYGIQPHRWDQALEAWDHALTLAADDIERQGVYTHMARIHIQLGNLDQAQDYLDRIEHPMYDVLKQRLQRNVNQARPNPAAKPDSDAKPAPGAQP